VLFLHGYQGSGRRVVGNDALVRAVTGAGYLLVAPNGRQGTWNHVGSPAEHDRDELAFLDRVRLDVLARWPVPADRLLVAGFSQGGSMVWDVACYRGGAYAGFAAIAGAFWRPLPETCPGPPVALSHTHGFADTVVPLVCRWIDDQWRQGDVLRAIALIKRHNACPAAPDATTELGARTCRDWRACAGGALRVCTHPGGHRFEPGWIAAAIDWVETRSAP
jgi:polyhydroxybutyrate depolymerase